MIKVTLKQLVAQQMLRCKLRLFVARITFSCFHVAKSRLRFYFLHHENLLRAEVVILGFHCHAIKY